MGNTINQCGKGCGKDGAKSINNTENLKASDRTRVNNFRNKCKKLSETNQKISVNKVDVIQDAMKDLSITEEPIEKYYQLKNVLGSGKYGVVKKGYSVLNPDFYVAVKVIDLEKLTGNFHS
jgi:hypothetical protein